MKTIRNIVLAIVMLLTAASAAFGAARAWEIDKAHAAIYFSIDHIFSKVRGHFNEFEAQINFDPADLAGSSFIFDITVDSIDTNISKRDKHLISADFFDAGTFPKMRFESKAISDAGGGIYNVAGTLTIKDKSYDLTLPLQLVGIKEHPAKKGTEVAGFNGTVTIDRLAHGVGTGKFYDMGVVGKDVEIFVSIEVLSQK
ncbi:MAG: YceI family protein [Desulfocapsaceae bacterium]|jgi:polyisoprenoid-binding protein YceI